MLQSAGRQSVVFAGWFLSRGGGSSNRRSRGCRPAGLGIGQAQLSKYEKGLSVPTLELLLKLKSYSGRSLDWIVMGGEAE